MKRVPSASRWIALAVIAGVAGCSQMQPPVSRAPQPPPAQPAPKPTAPPAYDQAITSLLQEAQTMQNQGELDRADAILNRALQIAPRDPRVWSRIANLRLAQGENSQAESFAQKSISLAGAGAALNQRNWDIIATARRARGDVSGATAAARKAAASHPAD